MKPNPLAIERGIKVSADTRNSPRHWNRTWIKSKKSTLFIFSRN